MTMLIGHQTYMLNNFQRGEAACNNNCSSWNAIEQEGAKIDDTSVLCHIDSDNA